MPYGLASEADASPDILSYDHASTAGTDALTGPHVNAYVPPHPVFSLQTFSVVMNEGNPDANNDPVAIDALLKVQYLKTSADISWWVASSDPVPYWATLPSGTLHVTANGTIDFQGLTYQPDTTPGLDTTFTLNFYPAGGISMAGYGSVSITILDDDSPYNGDDNANRIDASSGNDVVNARGGDDHVNGLGGNDTISGGLGNDTIVGGAGQDFLRGDTGDDFIHGNGGNDHIYGGDGNDVLYGDSGNDFISGGAGSNVLTGGWGADTFLFDQYFTETNNEIKDFAHGVDHIQISLAAWRLSAAPGFENSTHPTLDGPELYYTAATHTLYYAPYGGSDDGSPYTAYAVAQLDNVSVLSKADFQFI